MKQSITRSSANLRWALQTALFSLSVIFSGSCKSDDVIIKIDSVVTWETPDDIYIGTALSATQLNATADHEGSFIYTPASGTTLSLGAAQDLEVVFSPTDSIHFNTTIKMVKINVLEKLNPVITWSNPLSIYEGSALSATQLNALANALGTYAYTPMIGTKLNAGEAQDLKVDFTPADTVVFNKASKTVKITVIGKFGPIVSWENPADIIEGTALSEIQLNATANMSGIFAYSPPFGTILNKGASQDLNVVFSPKDSISFSKVSKTVKINVNAN